MTLSKKLQKLSLVGLASTVGLSQVAQASWVSDSIDNGLTNISEGGHMNEYNPGGGVKNTMFYTTSVYFRFGSAQTYPEPFWQFTDPKISVGCSGINIKGMFMKLAGIDRLESTLKNAGVSLGWGIVVGLIYSLPGIAASFKMLNDWAKKLQALLANACQSGIALGKQAANISGLDTWKGPKFLSDMPADAVDKSVDKKPEEVTKHWYSGVVDSFNADMVYTFDPITPAPTVAQSIKYFVAVTGSYFAMNSLASDRMSKLLINYGAQNPTGFVDIMKEIMGAGFETDANQEGLVHDYFVLTIDNGACTKCITVEDFVDKLAAGRPQEEKSALYLDLQSLILLANFSSDVVLNQEGVIKTIIDKIGKKIKALSSGTITDDEKDKIDKFLSGNLGDTTFTTSHPQTAETFGANYGMYLYDGNSVPQVVQEFISQDIKGVKFNIVVSRTANNTPGQFITYIMPGGISDNSPAMLFDTTFTGIYDRSKSLYTDIMNTGDVSTAISTNKVQNYVPGLFSKMAIIQRSPAGNQVALIEILATYNAFKAISAISEAMLDSKASRSQPNYFLYTGSAVTSFGDASIATNNRQLQNKQLLSKARQWARTNIKTFKDKMEFEDTSMDSDYKTLLELNKVFDYAARQNKARVINNIAK